MKVISEVSPNEMLHTESTAPKLGRRKTRWGSVALYTVLIGVTVAAAPYYIWRHGLSAPQIALFTFYFFATSFAITTGYHRCFAHATFKPHPAVEFLLLFFGAATFEQSALKWSSQHRSHHQYTDTDRDPYNIKRGFFYAHIGWIMFWKHPVSYDNVKDLQKRPMVMHQHQYYQGWSLFSGVLLPIVIGFTFGEPGGALILSVGARILLVMNSAFFINSYAHTFGTKPYDLDTSARDNWLGAILTNGEGYHNYHHRFPNDYRNGIRWYHYDPTKWLIWVLSLVGLAKDLRRTPQEQIQNALRLTRERKSA